MEQTLNMWITLGVELIVLGGLLAGMFRKLGRLEQMLESLHQNKVELWTKYDELRQEFHNLALSVATIKAKMSACSYCQQAETTTG